MNVRNWITLADNEDIVLVIKKERMEKMKGQNLQEKISQMFGTIGKIIRSLICASLAMFRCEAMLASFYKIAMAVFGGEKS